MKQSPNIKVIENASLKNLNTYKIESKTKYLVTVLNLDGLKEVLSYIKDNNIKYFILGNGSNVILDEYLDGITIKLDGLNNFTIKKNTVICGAGVNMSTLTCKTVNKNLTGLEWAINIPGTVGGSIIGNAGAYNRDIFDNLESIKVIDKDLNIKVLKKEDIIYSYRHTNLKENNYIVIEGTFKLKKGNKEESLLLIKDRTERRKKTQPIGIPSAGSVFRNPPNDHAGRLIENSNLKGKTIGGASVSKKHANFIVNTGNATSKDIKNLIQLIQKEVKEKFNIDLILEQEIIDWK